MCVVALTAQAQQPIDLSGEWQLRYDSGKQEGEVATLPGSFLTNDKDTIPLSPSACGRLRPKGGKWCSTASLSG